MRRHMLRSLPAGDIMTKCIIEKYKDSGYRIEVSGHCENARLCTGISTLVAGLSGWGENFDSGYSYKEDDGWCEIKLTAEAKEPVMMFYIALSRMELMHPDMIKVINNNSYIER